MKKINRYQGAAFFDPDFRRPVITYEPNIHSYLQRTQHNVRSVDFDDKGQIIRFETKEEIFVKVGSSKNSCGKVLRP